MAEDSHRPALRVTALHLSRFLGLQRRDQALQFAAGELSPGVTVIAGPNGSGKTTTARALEGLLWPESVTDPLADVHGNVDLAGESWTVELAGPTARWWRAGTAASGPAYCPASERDRYRLSLHELLTADDALLAAAVRRELGGGYSLVEAAAQLGFSEHPTLPRKALQRLRQADEAVAQATREQASLRRSEADLVRLRAEEAEARQAAARLETVAGLLRWREAGRTLQAKRRQLALYDPRACALRGKELEQFQDLQRRLTQAEAACTRAAADLAALEARLSPAPDEHTLPSPECLSRCRSLALQLQQAENDLRRADAELAGTQAREAAARQVLAAELAAEKLALLDRLQPDAALAEAVQLAAAADVAARLLEGFQALPMWSEPVPELAALEAQHRGLDVLRAWLQEPPVAAAPGARPGVGLLPFWVAVAGALLALLLAIGLHWSMAFAAVLFGVLAWLTRPRPVVAVAPSRRPEFEAAFAGLGLTPPRAWEPAAVAQSYDELALRWSLGAGRRELAGQGTAARKVLEQQAAEQRRALDACLAHNAARLGITLDHSPLAVFHLVTRIAAWQAARDELAHARQTSTAAREQADGLLERLRGELAQSGKDLPVDSAAAVATVEALEKDLAARAAAQERRDEQARAVERERRSVVEFTERRQSLLESVGLRPAEWGDAEALLQQWSTDRPAATTAAAALQAATVQVTQCRAEARRAATAAQDLRSLRTPQLEQCAADLERAAARRDALVRQIESTETLVREAKRKHDLEQRLAERAAAMAELLGERDEGWRALAGDCCLSLVAARLEMQSSGVLRQAQHLFAQITQGRYRLLADEAKAAAVFRARDTQNDRVHDLDELSSGTRVQLLLAARLAFIAEREGDGPLLPLVLDELLANSDDARAATVMDVVIEAARAGRQVFCFTAQQDEVSKWQARLAQTTVPFALCWLPRNAAPPPAVSLAPVPPPRVPEPHAGETAVEYAARLGVPSLDRFETDAGSLHLWYLVDEPQVLHALLQAGYRTWGQLALLLHAGGVDGVVAGGLTGAAKLDPRRLEAKAELVVLVLALLRIGHGRPLGRAALAASGLVTGRFLDEVAGVLENVGGDAALLLERLAQGDVKGFRSGKVELLSAWLSEQGYVDSRPELTPDEIRARVHSTAAGYLVDGVLTLEDVRGVLRLLETGRQHGP
jgi:energy-coupling factor transporter ATP-binding protein EcfA2